MFNAYESSCDFLFDCENLNYSLNKFRKLIDSFLKEHNNLAVCLLDISNFKFYNYISGYEFGDKVLEFVLNKIKVCINDQGHVCRFGGNILLIILNIINSKEEIVCIIDKIVEAFNEVIFIDEQMIKIIINIGISLYPIDSDEVDIALKYAEIALQCTKKVCETNYKFFEAEMYEDIIKKRRLELDIERGFNNNEFILYYQPQIDTTTLKIYGMEALLRWNHIEYGILAPSYFIDIIEQNGMINKIGEFVFIESCRELKKYHDMGYSNLSVSINVSEKQLQDEAFLFFVYDTLEKTQIDPKYLNIEITERILVNPTKEILNLLSAMKNKGIKIFIDDFGTGYSSLNYLYMLPVDGIKIDKSFVDMINYSEKELKITKNIINLAKEINLEVVAEGVEKKEQLDYLISINCNKIQGYIFGKPVPSSDFTGFLKVFYF